MGNCMKICLIDMCPDEYMMHETLSKKLKEACTISVKLLPQIKRGETKHVKSHDKPTRCPISTLVVPEDSKPAVLGISTA